MIQSGSLIIVRCCRHCDLTSVAGNPPLFGKERERKMSRYEANRRLPFARGGEATVALATTLWAGILLLWHRRSGSFFRLLLTLATILWTLILYFFRDPHREVRTEPGVVVSPGDGEVVAIVREYEPHFIRQEMLRISIFLSIFDVHVQRVPLAGRVAKIEHRPGKYLQAFRPEASLENEAITMQLATPHGPLLVRQIAGIMARRCVNYLAVGDNVETGQRFGLIRFGSRVDLFLPPTADVVTTIGTKVKGGVTLMARFTK